MAVVFAVGLLHAAAYALLVPPWQAPDEPGHMEYACLMGQLGRVPLAAERSAGLQAEIIASLGRSNFWPQVREVTPDPLPATFAGDAFLRRSGTQLGDEPPLYYVVPALMCRLGLPLEGRLALVRLFGAVLFGLTGAVTAWGVGWRGPAQLVPLVLVLLPMPAFIAGSANNDGLAMLAATAVFATVRRQARRGWSWRGALVVAALLALALASKKTTVFLVPWLGVLAAAALWRRYDRGAAGRGPRRWKLGLAAAVAALAGIVLLAGLWPAAAPSAWRSRYLAPGLPVLAGRAAAQGVSAGSAGTGAAARVVPAAGYAEGRLYQTLPQAVARGLRGQTVAAQVWVRSTAPQAVRGRLTVRDGGGYSEVAFAAGPQWQAVALSHAVDPAADYVKLAVTALPDTAGEGLLVDDALLGAREGENLLANAGFAAPARWGEGWVAPLVERWTGFLPGGRVEAAISAAAMRRYVLYGGLTFAGFWGNFGWLQRPLPVAVYGVWAVVCAVAAVGVGRALREGRRKVAWGEREEPGLRHLEGDLSARLKPRLQLPEGVWTARLKPRLQHPDEASTLVEKPRLQHPKGALALVGPWVVAVGLVVGQALAPMVGWEWQPQGRYLFPALLPMVGLGLVGLAQWRALRERPALVPVGMGLLVAFDMLCLAWACYGG